MHLQVERFKGGWSGNEGFVNVLEKNARTKLESMVKKFGERFYQEGYKGTFCIGYLIDKKDGCMYLCELNPRISGALGGLLFGVLTEFMGYPFTLVTVGLLSVFIAYVASRRIVLPETLNPVN